MQIKIIAVGSSKWERFIRRWGVSFLIGEDILFDTFGNKKVFLRNLKKFNIDTTKIKHIVLSHDDWDHVSGLWHLLSNRQDITVYICPGFKEETKTRIASFGVKVIEVREATQIKNDIYSTGELCGESKGEKICEQSVVVKTAKGLTVICGCAHPKIAGIIRHVKDIYRENVYAIIGGFHLKDNNQQEISAIITKIKSLGITKIAPMHCTGRCATKIMRDVFASGFIKAQEGDKIEL